MRSRKGITILRVLVAALVLLFLASILINTGGEGLRLFSNVVIGGMEDIGGSIDNAINEFVTSPSPEPEEGDGQDSGDTNSTAAPAGPPPGDTRV